MYDCSLKVLDHLHGTGNITPSTLMLISHLSDVHMRMGHVRDAEQLRARACGALLGSDWPAFTKKRFAEIICRNTAQSAKDHIGSVSTNTTTKLKRRNFFIIVSQSIECGTSSAVN